MKRIVLLIVLALVAAGAVCMSYSSYWVFDALGALAVITGGIVGTISVIKCLKKPQLVTALIALYTAVVLLIIAGSVLFSGTILIAILGTAALVIFGFLVRKK